MKIISYQVCNRLGCSQVCNCFSCGNKDYCKPCKQPSADCSPHQGCTDRIERDCRGCAFSVFDDPVNHGECSAPVPEDMCAEEFGEFFIKEGKDCPAFKSIGPDPLNIWNIIKCATNNGERIGIIQERSYSHGSSVLATAYTEFVAIEKLRELSIQLNVPTFNNDFDVWIG